MSYEVIVIDDGSDDETARHLAALEDSRVRVIRHEIPRGVAVGRNAGIEAALGRWVSFLDDDDLWSPHKLRAQLDAADKAQASFVYSGGAGLDAQHRFRFAIAPPDPAGVARELLRWNVIWSGGSNVMARADTLRELGGFDEKLFQLADWDLWIRLALAGPAVAVDEILVGYVMHAGSMLLTDRRDVFREFEYLVDKHRNASAEWATEFDEALFTRWVARGHRLAGRRSTAARTYLRGFRTHGDLGGIPRALGAFAPEKVVELARALAANERRSSFKKLKMPEPEWIGVFRT